jgi:hypothetical protein
MCVLSFSFCAALIFIAQCAICKAINGVLAPDLAGNNIMSYFAVCVVARAEHLDIVEWVEYHLRMGASKIYLFDDKSSPPMFTVLKEYIERGDVEYQFSQDREPNTQFYAYEYCLKYHGHKHNWMAFIDSDEYIALNDTSKSIPEILERYTAYGGLAINWKIFGSSGHVERPWGGVLPNYWRCTKNFHIKSIVQPKYVRESSGSSHSFTYKNGYFSVDTAEKRLIGNGYQNPDNPALRDNPPEYLFDIMYIHHYITRNRKFFEQVKLSRGRPDRTFRPAEWFDDIEGRMHEDCPILKMPDKHFPKKPSGTVD